MEFRVVTKTVRKVRSRIFEGQLDFCVELPLGYAPVAFRVPQPGEQYLYGNVVAWCSGKMKRSFLIVKENHDYDIKQ